MTSLEYDPSKTYIASIDIGVKNLAIVLCSITSDFELEEIIWFDRIDITDFIHLNEKEKCCLYHEKTLADYLSHLFLYFHHFFDICSTILVERQPLEGYTSVEQLFFYKYREKAVLISPNSVHAFLKHNALRRFAVEWNNEVYDVRKEKTIEIMKGLLEKNKQRDYLVDYFDTFERQHDISDAVCMVLYYLYRKEEEKEKEDEKEKRRLKKIEIEETQKRLRERIEEEKKKGNLDIPNVIQYTIIGLEQYKFTK